MLPGLRKEILFEEKPLLYLKWHLVYYNNTFFFITERVKYQKIVWWETSAKLKVSLSVLLSVEMRWNLTIASGVY